MTDQSAGRSTDDQIRTVPLSKRCHFATSAVFRAEPLRDP